MICFILKNHDKRYENYIRETFRSSNEVLITRLPDKNTSFKAIRVFLRSPYPYVPDMSSYV